MMKNDGKQENRKQSLGLGKVMAAFCGAGALIPVAGLLASSLLVKGSNAVIDAVLFLWPSAFLFLGYLKNEHYLESEFITNYLVSLGLNVAYYLVLGFLFWLGLKVSRILGLLVPGLMAFVWYLIRV